MNMLKRSKKIGRNTLTAEIQGITKEGIWLLLGEQEFFLPFAEYPWFKKASVEHIYDLQLQHGKTPSLANA
jgi:hypothetical protein